MNVFAEAARLERENTPFALAHIIESHGSTPRHSGQMIVLASGQIFGTIGGGVDFAACRGKFLGQQAADRFLVVDHEDGIVGSSHCCSTPGRETRKAEPTPTVLVTVISPLCFLTME
mgnify:CR=1 FL=1